MEALAYSSNSSWVVRTMASISGVITTSWGGTSKSAIQKGSSWVTARMTAR